jgi:predicted phosphodiesterase
MIIKSIVLSDIHFPFQNDKALKVVDQYLKDNIFHNIYLLGDIIDFYALSDFNKNPDRATTLQEDLNTTKAYLTHIRSLSLGSHIYFIDGNHEVRLKRYLWKHPEISSLDALSLPNLLGFKENNIMHKPQYHIENNMIFEHGSICRKHSAYTAKAMFEKRGMSGMSGHTHRLGHYLHTNMTGSFQWLENGCLCSLEPEYLIGVPDWINGFSIIENNTKTKRNLINQIPIIRK